mgnify:CR=1 FL=1
MAQPKKRIDRVAIRLYGKNYAEIQTSSGKMGALTTALEESETELKEAKQLLLELSEESKKVLDLINQL